MRKQNKRIEKEEGREESSLRGQITFLHGRGSAQDKCEAFVPGILNGTNALVQMRVTNWYKCLFFQ
jgi:hypothetical protein